MMRWLLLIPASVSLIACSGVSSFGAPCGGGQFADAYAFLPDSGINAGDTIRVVFIQHDTQELTELVIWNLGPFASGAIDPAPNPRVRIVADDGRVLLDSVGSRYNQPENGTMNRRGMSSHGFATQVFAISCMVVSGTRPYGSSYGASVHRRRGRESGSGPTTSALARC